MAAIGCVIILHCFCFIEMVQFLRFYCVVKGVEGVNPLFEFVITHVFQEIA